MGKLKVTCRIGLTGNFISKSNDFSLVCSQVNEIRESQVFQ